MALEPQPVAEQGQQEKKKKKEYDNRADFIKRLFAVIVSVGFAAPIIQLKWTKPDEFPTWTDAEHIAYLIVGLFLIIQSWENYFLTIDKRPLKQHTFLVDVVIVFTYLLLLISSTSAVSFLLMVCVIFFLYAIWGYLSYSDHRDQFPESPTDNGPYLKRVLISAWSHPKSPLRSKLSTYVALVWFVELYLIYLDAGNPSPWVFVPLVLVGLIGYRYDQNEKKDRLPPAVLLSAVAVLFVVWLYVHFF